MESALGPVLELLQDADSTIRQGAAYAAGNFAKVKTYNLDAQILLLADTLADANISLRTAASWALWKLAARRDVWVAVPGPVRLLEFTGDYDVPRKNAAGALLSFARKSAANRVLVQQLTTTATLDSSKKEISKFLSDLHSQQKSPRCHVES